MRDEPRVGGGYGDGEHAVARHASTGGRGVATWWFGFAFFGIMTAVAVGLDAGLFALIPLVPTLFSGLFAVLGTAEVLAARLRWLRASRGRVTRTLHGHAVGMRRRVSGNTLRTVVIDDDGERRYAHLLVPDDADDELLEPGAVDLDLFTGRSPAGPVRLRQGDGVVLWAFAVRIGRSVEPGAAGADLTWSGDDGWDGGPRWGSGGGWTDDGDSDADADQDAADD